MTFSNIEHLSMSFVEHTLQPICTQIEQEMNYKLFTTAEQKQGFYVKFNMTSALRADSKTRAEYYQMMVRNGFMTVNEVRALEELDKLREHGDRNLISQDLTFLDNLGNVQSEKGGE